MSFTAVLHIPLGGGAVAIAPLVEAHREELRAACAADSEIWDIYPVCLVGAAFDPNFDAILSTANRLPFALLADGVVVGTTSWWLDAANAVAELGGTYIVPVLRGTGYNRAHKLLLIDHAFDLGIRRIEFRIDVRNTRSCAAVLKLGARREGTLRRNRVTWTGHVRDTAVFGLLPDDGE